MCLLADMIQQEKSRYKGEFAEACVTLALERSTGCKLVTRRDSVSPEVAKTLDFPLNFVEFLNRSYPVVQAAMGNASVCDIFFAQHCQHSALTKALCINEMRWILIDFIQPPGKLLWWPLPRGCGEIPGLLQATSTTPWLSWAEKSIWQRCSMLETAQNSWMSSEISNWKRGTSASNHLVLRLRDDVDTDAAPSPLVEARRGTCQPVPEFTCSWFVCFSSRFWRIFLPQCDPCWRETPWAERVVPVRRLKSGVGSGFAARTSATRRGLTMSQRNLLSTLAQETPKKGNLWMSSACPGAGITFLLMRIARSFLEMSGAEDQQHSCACPMSVTWCC